MGVGVRFIDDGINTEGEIGNNGGHDSVELLPRQSGIVFWSGPMKDGRKQKPGALSLVGSRHR